MVDMKRTLTSNESPQEDSKKFRNELSSVENLSNEIFYEIFDYLDGLDICQAFSNINSRFQQLVICSSIRYKINLGYSTRKEKFLNNYKQIQHQISSISFIVPKKSMNEFLTIDYSFNNLQSIRIDNIDKDKLIQLLIHLSQLPCLYSLDIQTTDSIEDLNQIYQLIFSLPKLKSNKLSLYGDEHSISIPISNNKLRSPIEDLHISHSYSFDELYALLSYTPKLRRLNLSHSNKDDEDIEDVFPIHLNDLIYLSMFTNSLNFDELQLFIEQVNSKLKFLHLVVFYRDIIYLHAYRWQQFIEQNFPQLEKFSLRYRESGFRGDHSIYDGGLNQFISPFWIQRNLIFEMEIHEYNNDYYIRPYKTRWYKDINSSIEHSKSSQLTIKYVYSGEPVSFLLDQVKRILDFAQVYHLNIDQQICDERLMQIIHLLPDLITLNINSLAFYGSECSIDREFPTSSALEHAKNIKYVCLEKAHSIEDIYFLMSFCPQMEYLNVECITKMNIQTFLKDILNKINQTHHEHLRLLCIYVTTADDQMIKQLNKMIDDEKLLLDYTIHRQLYNIYLKWK